MHSPTSKGSLLDLGPRSEVDARVSQRRTWLLFATGGFIVVVLLGIINLDVPFGGDQALFTVAAKALDHGKVLYRDFWDLKQPGVFWFYWIGGRLFGFNEAGVHRFELLWMAALAICLIIAHRRMQLYPWGSALAALLPVGGYYISTGVTHLTQVEAIVCLPLFISAWLSAEAARSDDGLHWKLFVAGLAGSVALLFKLMFLPILLAMWGVSLVYYASDREIGILRALRRAAPSVIIGTLAPLAVAVVYFLHAGALGSLLRTTFFLPPRIVKEVPWTGFAPLANSMNWYFRHFATLLAVGTLGGFIAFRRRKDPLVLNLAAWWTVGLVINLLQRTSWWPYHYMLLVVPTGMLAVIGIEELVFTLRRTSPFGPVPKWLTVFCIVLLCAPFFDRAGAKAIDFAYSRGWIHRDPAAKPLVIGNTRDSYKLEREDTTFLRESGSIPGDIYVFGNPVIYLFANRGQAVALNGWIPELFLPEQWDVLLDEFERAHPVYIFVDIEDSVVVRQRSPKTMAYINEHYREYSSSSLGTWYVIKTPQQQQ